VLIAVIADTHLPRGARRLPAACVQWLRRADLILHAGDFSARSALDELHAFDAPVLAVHGNVDPPSLRRELPERRLVEAEGARIGMLHDAGPRRGRLDRLRAAFPEADAVVFGHSHLPLHEERDSFQIFNPGSPTERRRAPNRSMGLANVEHDRIRFELVDLGA
jgi:uncharacterized protein